MIKIKSVLILLIYIIVLCNCAQGQSSLDSILKLPKTELLILETQTKAVDSLSRIKYTLAKKNIKTDIQRSLLLFDEALLLAEEEKDQDFSIQIKKSKSLVYINLRQMDLATELLDQATKYYKKSGAKAKYGSCLLFYAYMYTETKEYKKALAYSFDALDLFTQLENNREIQGTNNRLGIIYSKIGNIEKALKYYNDNITISKENKWSYRASLNNAGGLYLKQGNLEKAEEYLMQAYEIRKKENRPKSLAHALKYLAELEVKKGNIDLALSYLDSAYLNFEKVEYRNGAAEVMTKKTMLLRDHGDYDKYRDAVIETYEKLREWNINNSEEEMLSAYADILFEKGRTKEAYINLQKSIQLYKDKYSENNFSEIEKLENQLRKEREESRIQELSKEIDVRNTQRKYIFLVLGLGIALIVLLLVTNRDRKKKNKAITKSLNEREILIKEIHHRVKNNLQIVSSILSLQSRNIKDVATKEAIVDSRDRVKSMALIHQKLYQENNLKGVDIKDYLENLVSSLSHSYNLNETDVKVKFDVDPLILDIDSTIPIGLITNELITNALKYAFNKEQQGLIWVSLKEINQQLNLQIKDNGTSIANPTEIKEGFGFQLIRSLARKLKATPEIIISDGLTIQLNIKNYKKITS